MSSSGFDKRLRRIKQRKQAMPGPKKYELDQDRRAAYDDLFSLYELGRMAAEDEVAVANASLFPTAVRQETVYYLRDSWKEASRGRGLSAEEESFLAEMQKGVSSDA
jgi:hypothetical protein